jgi:hypothetical protein
VLTHYLAARLLALSETGDAEAAGRAAAASVARSCGIVELSPADFHLALLRRAWCFDSVMTSQGQAYLAAIHALCGPNDPEEVSLESALFLHLSRICPEHPALTAGEPSQTPAPHE